MNARILLVGVSVAAGALFALAPGCSSHERLDPIGGAVTVADVDAGAPDAPTPEPETPIRQVITRSPFGGPPDNLLADGDFELSIVPTSQVGGQYAWNAFDSAGTPIALQSETGGTCRSGIRCGAAKKGAQLLGRGTAAPNGGKVDASIWLKPLGALAAGDPAKACKAAANVYLVKCDTFDILATLKAADAPNDTGWCEYYASSNGSPQAICMFIDVQGDVLADSAKVLPSLATKSAITPYSLANGEGDRLRALGTIVRRRMRFDRGATPSETAPAY